MSRLRRALLRVLPTHHTAPTAPVPGPVPGPVPDPVSGTTDSVSYAPEADGEPDPGEVVWGWVPYDDDPSQGKDRPVLLLGRRGDAWLALMLSSQDHDLDAEDEARWGRFWLDVGSGGWDAEGRPSEVRLDRLLELAPTAIRREGAALPQPVFEQVLAAARQHHDLV